MSDPADCTASELIAGFEDGSLSPVEAAEACLERQRRHDDAVNAFCFRDEERTLAAARESERRYRDGEPRGLLDGVPIAIKDILLSEGWPIRKGSKLVADAPGKTDCPAVAALRRHGGVPIGITTTPEFGWKGVTDSPLCGATGNPYDPTRTAGGSSGGSATAIPLGMTCLALGTDAGGSIRIPAGFSGVVGLKPTHGVCPMWPPSAFSPLAHVGPMTRTVADCALLLDVLAEPDPRDPTAPPPREAFRERLEGGFEGLRIAYSRDYGFVDVDSEIAEAVEVAARVFADGGATVESVDPGFEDPRRAFDVMFFGGAANALRDLGPEQRAQMDPALVAMAEWGASLTLLDYMAAANERLALIERMHLFHRDWDLLLSPSLPIPAFAAGREVPEGWADERWPSWTPFTYPFNLTGQPGISVPCGFTAAGLPIGLQLIGPRWGDDVVLRAAHAYRAAVGVALRPPALLIGGAPAQGGGG